MPLIILFLFLCFFSFPLKAEILSSSYELSFSQEKGLLQGRALFTFDKEGFYTFSRKGLKIIQVKQGEELLKIHLTEDLNYFKLYLSKKERPVEITFEKSLSLKESPYPKVYEDYLPYPETPVPYEILIEGGLSLKERLMIPSEKSEVLENQRLFFKVFRPLKRPPPLILASALKERVISLKGKELIFYIEPKFSEREWKRLEGELKSRLEAYEAQSLPIPFQRLFFIASPHEKILPLSIFFRPEEPGLAERLLKSITEETLKFGLYLEEELSLKVLTLYYAWYKLSPNRIESRRNLLINPSEDSKAFFYFYEKLLNLWGEERFDKLFKEYYERFLTNSSGVKPPESFLKNLLKLDPKEFEGFFRVTLEVKSLEVYPLEKERGFQLRLILSQGNTFRPLKVTLYLHKKGEALKRELTLDERVKVFEFTLKERLDALSIDPDYQVYRNLTLGEIPLGFDLLEQTSFVAYLPQKEHYSLYRDLIERFRPHLKDTRYGAFDLETLPPENLLFFESPPRGYHFYLPEEGFYFKIMPHPFSQGHFLALVKASSIREIKNFLKEASKYKGYSELWLKGKKIVFEKGEGKGERGIQIKVTEGAFKGMRPSQLKTLADLLPELLGSQVLLVGENHDQFSHHQFQLELIKGLYQYYKDLVIGLEMVQSPFQKYLDDFVAGRLSEKELLERIEYYDRWRFDYRLYREIFLFAREKRLRLLALDLPTEIVKKVSKEGIASLTQAEKLQLPELDLYRPEYKAYLEKVFKEHKFSGNETNFEYFYQAQVLRDENMAERVVEFLRKNPFYKMVVLVGKGHLQYGLGIPASLKRRNFYPFKTIILGEVERVDSSLGDYWFLPESVEYEGTPQLGVVLEEKEQGLLVKEVLSGSLAEKAGLKPGDILLKADDKALHKVSDLKIILTFKAMDETLKLGIERNKEKLNLEIKMKKGAR